jgi:hypothetical protein
MNLEKRFIDIQKLLIEHLDLIQVEALDLHSNTPEKYIKWLKELNKFSPSEKRILENELSSPKGSDISLDYNELLDRIRDLIVLKKLETTAPPINKILLKKINLKKQHEIAIIDSQLRNKEISQVIDIGSGAGHLSSILLHGNERESLCIDQENKYQEIGRQKFLRDMPELLRRLEFQTCSFTRNTPLKTAPESIIIGLHACGNLSVDILRKGISSRTKMILNYGCCFHKLDPAHLNLSQLGKEKTIRLSNHALTMASKSYKRLNVEDIDVRTKVKRFRYSLHLYREEFLNSKFQTLGNASKQDYDGSFSDYALKYCPDLSISTNKEELEYFYSSIKTKTSVGEILNLGIIRSHFARLIEVYIIIDRALYLKENGFNVELLETFNRDLSPRNISLFASR